MGVATRIVPRRQGSLDVERRALELLWQADYKISVIE